MSPRVIRAPRPGEWSPSDLVTCSGPAPEANARPGTQRSAGTLHRSAPRPSRLRWAAAALVSASLVTGVLLITSVAANRPAPAASKVLPPVSAGVAAGLGPAKRAVFSAPAAKGTAPAANPAPPAPPAPANGQTTPAASTNSSPVPASTSKSPVPASTSKSAVPASSPSSSSPPQTVPPGTPVAKHFGGMSTVGPLFSSAKATKHSCTASVVDSPAGDLILTAAHCVNGTGAGVVFAPGYDQGKTPYGLWQVTGSHGAPSWLQGRSDQRDFAFLEVAPKTINGKLTQIQDVTGGAQLGEAATAGETVTVPAYASGSGDQPLTCTTKVYLYEGFPAFNCNPYPDGTSGAPWLESTGHGSIIVGVIGGLHHGGCYTYTSYTSAIGTTTWNAYARAAASMPTATFPAGGSDGCPAGGL